MTLVAFNNNNNNPVLFADILVTSREKGKEVVIPNFLRHLDDKLPKTQESFPYSFRQKLYVIADQIALLLAGNVYQMTLFLGDIKQYFRYYPPTRENYETFINEYDKDAINECSIFVTIIAVGDPKPTYSYHYHGSWFQLENPYTNFTIADGTGANALFKQIKHLGQMQEGANSINGCLIMLASFAAEEKITINSIIEAWGAGFEIAEVVNNKFRKLDDRTYVIWDSEIDYENKDLISQPSLIIHYQYFKELLIINTFARGEIGRYLVLPLDVRAQTINLEELPGNIDYDSKTVVSTFIIKEGTTYTFPTVVTHPGDGVEAVKIRIENTGDIQVMIKSELTKDIAQMLIDRKNTTGK